MNGLGLGLVAFLAIIHSIERWLYKYYSFSLFTSNPCCLKQVGVSIPYHYTATNVEELKHWFLTVARMRGCNGRLDRHVADLPQARTRFLRERLNLDCVRGNRWL
jgi:hypothetical protein